VAALIRLVVLLVILALAAPARAAVTSSSITTPADPTFSFRNNTVGAPVTNFTVNGTTNGTAGDQVDLRCYLGGGSGIVATGINVQAGGSFSYTGTIKPLDNTVCRLRAVPSASIPSAPPDADPSDDTFKGPIIAASRFDVPPGGSFDSTNGGFDAFDSQLTGLFSVISAGGCGIYGSNVLNPVTLARSNGFFYCNGGFFTQTGGAANRPYLKVDGTPAYAPTALPQGAFGTVTVTNTMTFDDASGRLTVEEVDHIDFCAPDPATFPATPSSCTGGTPSGVQLARTTVFDHNGRVATVTDHWSSTDGHEHALDVLYDQEFESSNSQNSFQFQGSGSYQRFASGAAAPTPASSPGSFFVKGSDAAPDGDEFDARGAVTYNDAPDAITFLIGSTVASPSPFTELIMHYARAVPATGSSTLQFQYANAFLLSEVQGYVASAESTFTPTNPPGPGPEPSPTPTPITNPIPTPVVTPVPTALPSFAKSGSASAKAVGKTVVVSTGQLVNCPAGGAACKASVKATAAVPVQLARTKTKKLVIGRATFTIPAGQSKKLTFKLNKKGALALRKLKKLSVKLQFAVQAGTGTPVTSTKTIRIKAPAKRRPSAA
jgi:hypothetical protein